MRKGRDVVLLENELMDTLLRAAATGCRQSQEELTQRFLPSLRAYVGREMGATIRRLYSIDDVCQDVLLRVFRTLSTLPSEATLETLSARLFQNVRWVLAEKAEKAKRFAGESQVGGGLAGARDNTTRTGNVTREDEELWLRSMVLTLEPKFSEVIRLRLQGWSFSQIGTELGENTDTIRKRYHKASKVLEEKILTRRYHGIR